MATATTNKAAQVVDDIQRKLRDDLVTAIVDKIQGGNVGSWLKPWDGFTYVPHNRLTGKPYSGGNILVLLTCGNEADMGRFATFKQWAELGFSVVKGSTSIPLVNWSERWLNCDECKAKTGATWAKGNRKCCPDAVGTRRLAPKYFRVFGASQVCPGPDNDGAVVGFHKNYPEPARRDPNAAFDFEAARIRETFDSVGATWSEIEGDRAFYSPGTDSITVPKADQFHDIGGYASTLAHEFGHWTGHESRLNRDMTGRFGSQKYAGEELVAELSSLFTCMAFGFEHSTLDSHSAYLSSWLEVLKSDDGPRALWQAASAAQRATDYIVGMTLEVEA